MQRGKINQSLLHCSHDFTVGLVLRWLHGTCKVLIEISSQGEASSLFALKTRTLLIKFYL